MIYSKELEEMCKVAKGVDHGTAPIPEEGKWVKAKEIKDISGLTHGGTEGFAGCVHCGSRCVVHRAYKHTQVGSSHMNFAAASAAIYLSVRRSRHC